MASALKDAWRALKHAIFLPFIFLGRYTLNKESEMWQTLKRSDHPAPVVGTAWLFVNGIMTDEKQAAANCAQLSRVFKRDVGLIYNPTKGLIRDLAECIRERTGDEVDDLIRSTRDRLLESLANHPRVIVIGHSQGAIILSAALGMMVKNDYPALCRLEAYTFAGAFDSWPTGPFYCEHFWNRFDYVARLGIGEIRPVHGVDYSLKASGHFLGAHYLPHFERGLYCGGTSRLYRHMVPEIG